MTIHIGTLLKVYFEHKRTRKAVLARALGLNNSTLVYYQKKESLQTKTLVELSTALKHNFFMDIALLLPPEYTCSKDVFEEKNNEIEALKEEVKKLTIERDVLLRVK